MKINHLPEFSKRKNRPEYSQDGALRAVWKEASSNEETVGILTELLQLLLRAVADDPQGLRKVQAEQLHKAFGVNLVVRVPDGNGESTGAGNVHKVLNVTDAAQSNPKFPHKKWPPKAVQKVRFRI